MSTKVIKNEEGEVLPPFSFTVVEKNWHHGLSGRTTLAMLHNYADKSKCCLGFLCQKMGVSVDNMTTIGDPASLKESAITPKVEKYLLHNDTLVSEIIDENDNDKGTLAGKKSRLKNLFKKMNIIINFT